MRLTGSLSTSEPTQLNPEADSQHQLGIMASTELLGANSASRICQ